MANHRKFYVVWEGHSPGIYDSWEECKLQTEGYQGAKFKAFDNQEAATAAFRGDPADHIGILKSIAGHRANVRNYAAIPEIRLEAIAVDGACAGNPGMMEYRGVRVSDGSEIFRVGPLPDGTNNVAEYLALVHALAMLDKQGDHTTPIYSDSRTAQSWLRGGAHRSKLARTPANAKIHEMLQRSDMWLASHRPTANPIIKWDTDNWGEIPADFGRK